MGKVKRSRQKLHISAAKIPNASNKVEVVEMTEADRPEADRPEEKSPMALRLSENIFGGLNINQYLLTKKLPEFDTRSIITSKSTKGLQIKKKDKKKLRHDTWLKKMNALEAARDSERERKRRQKTVIVGDMAPLADTLPTLELLLKSSNSSERKSETEKKTKGIRKMKQRQKHMLQDMAVFKQVLAHPEFIKNPAGTITEHLHNKKKLEDENMDT